jgi:hypothetical protein
LSGLFAERQVFVPEAGGFVRFLDTLTNPTATPMTVEVEADSQFNGIVHIVVDPADTGNTYAVTRADPSNVGDGVLLQHSALGHVFGGLSAAVPVDAVVLQHLIGTSYARWTVTVPAGVSVTLMHFSVQRAPNDTAGAAAQAQALVNLSDPNALAAMTAEEKARVVNFRIQ